MSCTLTGLHTTHLQKPPLCQFSRTGQYCTALKMASYQDITIKTYNTKIYVIVQLVEKKWQHWITGLVLGSWRAPEPYFLFGKKKNVK